MQEEAECSGRFRELKKKQQECAELELDYDTRLDRFSSSMSLISRQITLRGQDIEQGIRSGNFGSLPRF